jgi:RimJ/RimL family protein N-acetyltransferase
MKHEYYIAGEKITLLPLSAEDLEMVRCWRNQPNVRRWFLDSSIISEEQQRTWYERYVTKPNDLMFIIEETALGKKAIGTAALYNIDVRNKKVEFGRLMIGDVQSEGKGYAKEATMLLCRFAMTELGTERVELIVFESNERARKLYLDCGFQKVETIEENGILQSKMELIGGKSYSIEG